MTPNRTFTNVWDAIAETPEQAENLKLRSALMDTVVAHIEKGGLSQTAAAKLFGVTQPRISDLMRGKIDLFSIDGLVNMLAVAGLAVELKVVARKRVGVRQSSTRRKLKLRA